MILKHSKTYQSKRYREQCPTHKKVTTVQALLMDSIYSIYVLMNLLKICFLSSLTCLTLYKLRLKKWFSFLWPCLISPGHQAKKKRCMTPLCVSSVSQFLRNPTKLQRNVFSWTIQSLSASLPLFHPQDKVKQFHQCNPSMCRRQRNICVTLSAVNKHGSEVLPGYKQRHGQRHWEEVILA